MKINFLSTLPFGKLNTYRENNINNAENSNIFDAMINSGTKAINEDAPKMPEDSGE